ncbi:MAG: DUF2155 domain-containing protein [Gemmobacter sp.]
MIRMAALALVLLAAPAAAQEVRAAPGAVLRWLDKVAGTAQDIEIGRGQVVVRGRLSILLDDCRYPADNPAGEGWAHVVIRDSLADAPVFSGWMVASSPALSALDHARYDVWLLRCAID